MKLLCAKVELNSPNACCMLSLFYGAQYNSDPIPTMEVIYDVAISVQYLCLLRVNIWEGPAS